MAFLNEFLMYLFKFIILGGITVIAVICGAKYKKSKIKKATAEDNTTEETEN